MKYINTGVPLHDTWKHTETEYQPIQHYIDKLQVLKEYLEAKIEGKISMIKIVGYKHTKHTIYSTTGIYGKDEPLTFEEYYQSVVLAQSTTNT